MQFRGQTLIYFGLSLILSPWAIHVWQERAADRNASPAAVVTQGQDRVACERSSVETVIGRLGCNTNAAQMETRRIDGSGALFVRAGN